MLEAAKEASEALWWQGERERVAVEAETRELQALWRRTNDQLRGTYGHLASILEQIHRGIDGIQDLEAELAAG